MRILLTGATGFIGAALARALEQRGHEVLRAGRGPANAVQVDFASVPSRDWWLPHLNGVDAVVNAVGILRETSAQSFDALHARAPIELFQAAVQAGVGRVVQVSALGADERATSRYHLSKKAADDVLRALPIAGAIVQPSLVYGAGGTSAALFNGLAAAPLLLFPQAGAMRVQPVHLADVVDGVVALLEAPQAASGTFAFAGPRAMPLRDYLRSLRRQMGWGRSWIVALPETLFLGAATLAGKLPGSMLDAETARMLLAGNEAPVNPLPSLLQRAPRDVDAFIPPDTAGTARQQSVLFWAVPALKAAVSFVWVWTAVVSLGLYPVQDSYALLARVGLTGALATVALYGAAVLDLAFGLLIWAPSVRLRRAVWAAQLLLIAGYTGLITLFLPEYWLHPYGPLSKNLPMMGAIALLWALEPRAARPTSS